MKDTSFGLTRRDLLKGAAAGAAGLALKPMISLASQSEHPLVGTAGRLGRSTPDGLGIDPAGIAAFVRAVNEKLGGLHSMMLLRHGKVAAESWWVPYEPRWPQVLFSLSKSFTSTAAGLAVAEGRLKVTDKVVSFFPDKLPAKVSENLAAMTVKDLLTMNTGHDKEPMRTSADWVKDFLAVPVAHQPGTHFLYNTSGSHVVAAIVQKVTGQRVLDYLTPRLFQPLGIVGATWEQSPSGIDAGGYGLMVRTEDIAKFGQLYLQKGRWGEKQIIPAAWVVEATSKQVPNGDPSQPSDWTQGYGYQFWQCRHGHYRGDGAFGQYCVVMQHYDAVLAITSGLNDLQGVLNAAWDHLLPAMSASVGRKSDSETKELLLHQERSFPTGKKSSPRAPSLSGKTYVFEPNDERLESATVTFKPDRAVIEIKGANGVQRTEYGYSGWIFGMSEEPQGKRPVSGRGAWPADNRLSTKLCFIDSPFEWTQDLVFDENGLTIENRKWNVGFGPGERPALKAKRA